jgi:hypothetical protein
MLLPKSQVLFISQVFNDRLGAYTISIRAPFPPISTQHCYRYDFIYTHTHGLAQIVDIPALGPRRPIQNVYCPCSTRDSLFLTFPSILHQAAVLRYRHCLDGYKLPEPKPFNWSASPSRCPAPAKVGGIGRQQPTILSLASRYRQRIPGWGRLEAWGGCQLNPSCLTFYHAHSRPRTGRRRCCGAEPATEARCTIFGVG